MIRYPKLCFLVACFLLFFPGAGDASSAPPLPPGNHTLPLKHGGRNRSYIAHLPPQVKDGKPLPLVLNLHGGGGNAIGQQSYCQMDPFADKKGFIVVYPNGWGFLKNRLLTWNAGTCCGPAARNNVDDVGFLLAVLDDLSKMAPVDPKRIYATGMSNGAMMAYQLAVKAPNRIAAIAPVAGAMVVKKFGPKRPVPVIHFHSVDDPRALYKGGLGPPFPLTRNRVNHPPVEEKLMEWVKFDGCPEKPRIEKTIQGKGQDEGHTATKYVYGPGREGTRVILWKLTGAGHVWPGGRRKYLIRLLGHSTHIINANQEMWAFFSKYSL